MLKNLPKDLIAAASGVLKDSAKLRRENYRKLVKQALEHFNAKSFGELNESEQKMFTEWVAARIDEQHTCSCTEQCHCGSESSLLYKQAAVNAHSGLPELGEEEEKEDELEEDEKADKDYDGDGKIETGSAEYLGSKDKAIKAAMKESHKKELREASEIDASHLTKRTIDLLSKLGKHKIEQVFSGIHGVIVVVSVPVYSGQSIRLTSDKLKALANNPLVRWLELDGDEVTLGLDYGAAFEPKWANESTKKPDRKLKENYASPEPSSAIGHRLSAEAPKHVDVLKDSDILSGSHTYRLLVQFVNGRPEILPPLVLPGAPSVEALIDIAQALPDSNGAIARALADALDVPSERPEHKGNDRE